MISTYLWCLVCCHIFCLTIGANVTRGQCLKTSSHPKAEISYMCKDLNSFEELDNLIVGKVHELTIINSNLTEDYERKDESPFQALRNISIIKSFIGPDAISWLYSLKKLQILRIDECSTHTLVDSKDNLISSLDLKISSLAHLQSLIIARSNISKLDAHGVSNFDNLHLSLPENKFECNSSDFNWLLELYKKRASDLNRKINLKNGICFVEKNENDKDLFPAIYTIVGHDFLSIMEHKWESLFRCPPKCHCSFNGVIDSARPMINVMCVGLNMAKLPSVIPRGASRCNFSNNSIDDLTPYFKNKVYETVSFMSIAHNHISYFDANMLIEYLRRRSHPDVVVQLDHNKLTKFPARQIMNATKELERPPTFYLGHNPYICSCDYIRDFRTMIYRRMHYILDVTNIKCSEDDPYNPGVMIYTLIIENLCPLENLFQTLDVINIFLGIIVLILLLNFIHNSYQYHKYRKLPWIIRKFNC